MTSARTAKEDRRARVAEIQAAQRRSERRRGWLIGGGAAVLALALIVPTVIVVTNEQRQQAEAAAAAEEAAGAPIEGLAEFEQEAGLHTTEPVTYEQQPPVGGQHHPTWQNCGFYDAPVRDEHAVHSLEHGAIWITHDPDLPSADVERLRELTERYAYTLVSPREGLPSPVVASAWGLQIEADGVDDERIEAFIIKYMQGEQTPEPGAACHGGIGA